MPFMGDSLHAQGEKKSQDGLPNAARKSDLAPKPRSAPMDPLDDRHVITHGYINRECHSNTTQQAYFNFLTCG